MKMAIRVNVESKHIIWAIYMLLRSGKRISKKAISTYLRCQMEQFGTEDDTLFGQNFNVLIASGELDNDPNYTKALELFNTKFSEMLEKQTCQ